MVSFGGSIVVAVPVVSSTGEALSALGHEASAQRGNLNGARGACVGTDVRAAGSFERMGVLWAAELSALGDVLSSTGSNTSAAGSAYAGTDAAQMHTDAFLGRFGAVG